MIKISVIKKLLSSIVLILIFTNLSHASDENSTNSWLGVFNRAKLSDGYYWWTEAQLRSSLDSRDTSQILFRTGLLKDIDSTNQIGFLYGYIDTDGDKEHRYALQHIKDYGILKGFRTSHRARFEVRTREGKSNLAERFRYSLRFEKQGSATLLPVIWDEAFVNMKTEPDTGNRIFDRNRFFVGFRYKKIKNLEIEFGYLNQFIPRKNEDNIEHILTLYLFI